MNTVFNGYQNLMNGTLNLMHEWPPNLKISLENSSFKIVDRSIMLHYHVLKHHYTCLFFVLLSSKPLTMWKVNVFKIEVKVNDELEKQLANQDVMDVVGWCIQNTS